MSGQPNNARTLIRRAIYKLKFRYGFPVDFYKIEQGAYDTQTGVSQNLVTSTRVRKAVVFPSLTQRNFFFSISVIQANSKFIHGGDITLDDRIIMVDSHDLPRDWLLSVAYYFYFENRRYDIKTAEALDNHAGWMIVGRRVQGNSGGQIHDLRLHDNLMPLDSFRVG